MLRLFRLAFSVALILPFLLNALGVLQIDLFEQLEYSSYDIRTRSNAPQKPLQARIVILDIDEKSLALFGRWPWGRDRLGYIVDTLFDAYHIRLLGFDTLFGEPDRSSGLAVLNALSQGTLADNKGFGEALKTIRPLLLYDEIMQKSLQGKATVLGYYFKPKSTEESFGQLPPALAITDDRLLQLPLPQAQGYGANLPLLQQAASGGGFFDNPLVDRDGVFRRVPLLQQYQGQIYPSLPLAMLLQWSGKPLQLGVAVDGPYHALESLHVGELRIPVDEQGAALVPYRGKAGSFPYISMSSILLGKGDLSILQGAIVLIGTTAPGLLDLRSTPVQRFYPGVEIHANMLAGMLTESVAEHPAYTLGYEVLLLLIIGVLGSFLLPRLSIVMMSVVTLFLLLAQGGINLFFWQQFLVLPIARPMLLTVLLYVLHSSYGFLIETRRKRQIVRLFGQYIPPPLVEEMERDPETPLSTTGDHREMTVLFSDIRDFTSMSEQFSAPQMTAFLNNYLNQMTSILHAHRGTIDKYIGDAIMAFWGAPLTDREHAYNALLCAWEMLQRLEGINRYGKERHWHAINIGIGISSGKMNVGNMGSDFRMSYTVIGDTVNLGARLEGLTKNYRIPLIVSAATQDLVSDFVFREVDIVRVKGRCQPESIYQPLYPLTEQQNKEKNWLADYQQALEKFRRQQWQQAEKAFVALSQEKPDDPISRIYCSRIARYRQHPPPPEWDGVTVFQHK